MNKRYLTGLLMLLVGLDLALTYWQNYQLPLDGDLVAIVLPAPWYSQVLHDPFGWGVLTKHEVYGGTNRFFAHASMSLFWKQVPHLLQVFTTAIDSLYVASALFTTITQGLIIFLLAACVSQGPLGQACRWGLRFWVAAALMVPLFQTDGYYEQMGVTNHAVTYTFFYALPMALLLVLLYPFYRAARRAQPLHLSTAQILLLGSLMVAIAFNGPIATAAVAVLLLGIGLYWLGQQWRRRQRGLGIAPEGWLSGQALGLLTLLGLLCLYSLYIGRYNSENTHDHTLGQLFQLLPEGVRIQLTYQKGLPLLLAALVVNAQAIRWLTPPSAERQWALNAIRWVGLFAVVYVLLLPFGGYRPYRPYLLRNDSVLPILLGMIYAYGQSAYFLLFTLQGRVRQVYLTGVLLLAATFTYADRTWRLANNNDGERWAMDQIARSPEPVVQLAPNANVLSWGPIKDYHGSDLQAEMLQYWGITDRKKLYFQ